MLSSQAVQSLCRQATGVSEATQGDSKLSLIAEPDHTRQTCLVQDPGRYSQGIKLQFKQSSFVRTYSRRTGT
jgi:hypothetical protein